VSTKDEKPKEVAPVEEKKEERKDNCPPFVFGKGSKFVLPPGDHRDVRDDLLATDELVVKAQGLVPEHRPRVGQVRKLHVRGQDPLVNVAVMAILIHRQSSRVDVMVSRGQGDINPVAWSQLEPTGMTEKEEAEQFLQLANASSAAALEIYLDKAAKCQHAKREREPKTQLTDSRNHNLRTLAERAPAPSLVSALPPSKPKRNKQATVKSRKPKAGKKKPAPHEDGESTATESEADGEASSSEPAPRRKNAAGA
jgi:hypothetical protein